MAILKIAAITLVCILVSSDAAKTSNLKGTVHLLAEDFKEPTSVHIIVQVNGIQVKDTKVIWEDCDKAKRTCPYIVKGIPRNSGKDCAVGINLEYVTNNDGPVPDYSESGIAWTGETVSLTDGSKQDFEYDITKTHPTIRLLHKDHAKLATKGQPKGSVYMEGTLHFEHTEEMRMKPDYIVVLVSVSGKSKKDATESAKIPWEKCSVSNKCEYSVESVPANIGQKCTVGVHLYYSNHQIKDNTYWTKNNILEVKGDVTQQDLYYNAQMNDVNLKKEAVSAKETTRTGNKKMITVNVQGTVEFVHDIGFPFSPEGILIQLKLDGETNGHKETDIPWFDGCHNNKCPFTIPDVHGFVDQTYKIGINTYTDENNKHEGLVSSTNSLALKAADNKLDIKYDISTHTFTLTAASDTASTSSSSVADKKVEQKGTIKITVKGNLHINLPSNVTEPDDVVLYFELEKGEIVHATPMGWPTNCTGNKCQYVIKDVSALAIGQKYIMKVSLHYAHFGNNSGELNNRLAWSQEFTVAQMGENTVNLKYDAGSKTLLRE